ncbi:2-dehydropantoate 2-reductase N-terminal domain-containing protein [Thermodesulfobacteriota bacterium]
MTEELENITIIGAGGIGGTVAAFLATAGEKVTVVDTSVPHIEAIRSNGLLVDGVCGERWVRFEKENRPCSRDRNAPVASRSHPCHHQQLGSPLVQAS